MRSLVSSHTTAFISQHCDTQPIWSAAQSMHVQTQPKTRRGEEEKKKEKKKEGGKKQKWFEFPRPLLHTLLIKLCVGHSSCSVAKEHHTVGVSRGIAKASPHGCGRLRQRGLVVDLERPARTTPRLASSCLFLCVVVVILFGCDCWVPVLFCGLQNASAYQNALWANVVSWTIDACLLNALAFCFAFAKARQVSGLQGSRCLFQGCVCERCLNETE